MPNTKIVATVGPASDGEPMLRRLLAAGVDVFRLNFSHGTQAQHAVRIRAVRSIAAAARKYPAILMDLQGPKIRLGRFNDGGCVLEDGAMFTITVEPVMGNCERASTSYADFAKDVKAGDHILLADGAVQLKALENDGVSVRCQVISGGAIGDNKGINVPGAQISAP